ncbi:MAG: hypothetical protein JEZ02_03255 [Desulfatibacillum sp.]|nr:hypothetical protein [Desulfatibacillum sp.]
MKRLLIFALLLLFVGAGQAAATWEYGTLPALDPAPDNWNASMVFVQNDVITNTLLLYSSGGDIYGWDPETGVSEQVVNPNISKTSSNAMGPAGLVLSYDQTSLYFHDNGYPTKYIFQYDFVVTPTATTYFTNKITCEGSIYGLAVNPWTDRLWFTSGDFNADNFYLYEVMGSQNNMKAILRAEVPTTLANSGTGPIIFKGPNTVLFGEASYAADMGTFHLVDSTLGNVLDAEYVDFAGGLADAVYGYNNEIYVATGNGQTVEQVLNKTTDEILASTQSILGMAFAGNTFYLGETDPISGTVSASVLSDTEAVTLVTPEEGYRYAALPALDHGAQLWNPSVAYYGQSVYYAGTNGDAVDIYAYSPISGTNELWADVDFSEGSEKAYGPSALTVGGDGYLYYNDFGNPAQFLYRKNLSGSSIATTLVLTDTIQGSIWDMTWNPWSESLWICTADSATDTFYLYEIKQNFSGIEGTGISFPMAHTDEFSGNGPIIFTDENTLYYGESGWTGHAYFHKVNVKTKKVTTDAVTFDGGLNAAVYGFDKGIFVSTGDGKAVYKINPSTNEKTLVAETANSIGDMTFDGSSLVLSGDDLLTIWKPLLSGVPDSQVPGSAHVLAQTDFCVVTDEDGPDVVGIQGGAKTTIESFKFIDPTTIDLPAGGPYNLRYGLLDFRAKVSEVGGTATIWIRFSENLEENREWWKLDPLKGWYKPENVSFFDSRSAILMIVDGSADDGDGVANGYVTDPCGPGYPKPKSEVTVSDDTSDCFVQTAGHTHKGSSVLVVLIGLGLAVLFSGRKAIRS